MLIVEIKVSASPPPPPSYTYLLYLLQLLYTVITHSEGQRRHCVEADPV